MGINGKVEGITSITRIHPLWQIMTRLSIRDKNGRHTDPQTTVGMPQSLLCQADTPVAYELMFLFSSVQNYYSLFLVNDLAQLISAVLPFYSCLTPAISFSPIFPAISSSQNRLYTTLPHIILANLRICSAIRLLRIIIIISKAFELHHT